MLGNIMVEAKNIDEAFEKLYEILSKQNLENDSRDGEVAGEVINAISVIEDPTRCIMMNPIRKMPIRYAIGEMLWYRSKNPALKEIQKYTKNWDRMSDDGVTVNSNYGHIIYEKFGFDQYEYCKELLKKNPETRQAIIHIKVPTNTIENPTKDLNCTVSLQFFLRDGKLSMTVYMRSNDLWFGYPYDVFQFTCLQIQMAMELGVELGTYTHISGSLHLYKRDKEAAENNIAKLKGGE